MTVSLWRAQPDGSRADDKPLRTVTSDTNGAYRFDLLHSGTYRVEVSRQEGEQTGSGVQTRTRSYYNQLLDVTGTRSYRAVLDKARDDSGPIQVRISDAVGRVDFGYAAPDPKVHVDKTTQAYDCNDERCTVGWDVVVDNAGTETLPAGSTVFDRMSADVTAVRASSRTQTQDDPFLTRFLDTPPAPSTRWRWTRTVISGAGGVTTPTSWATGRTSIVRCRPGRPGPERPNLRFVQVQAADTRGMALDENGVLWGWGNNHHWQIHPPPASLVNARGEVTVYADGYENGRYLYVKRPTKTSSPVRMGQPVVFRRFRRGSRSPWASTIRGMRGAGGRTTIWPPDAAWAPCITW